MYIDKFTSTVREILFHVQVLSVVKISTECKNNYAKKKITVSSRLTK